MTATWWIDGVLVPAAQARIAADDHGLVAGDGVFETLRTAGGVPFAVGRHLDRLRRSASGLGLAIPYSDGELRAAIAATVAARAEAELRVRVTVTGGPGPLASGRGAAQATVLVGAEPLSARRASAAVCVTPWCRNERGATVGLKTTSYAENVLALRWARERGADEAVFVNTAGALCEGTGSNVFVVIDGRVFTPPLAAGCLAGVTRALLLEAGVAAERDLPIAALIEADEAFLTSTTRDVQPVRSVDGRPLRCVDGPATRAAAEAFAAIAARTSEP